MTTLEIILVILNFITLFFLIRTHRKLTCLSVERVQPSLDVDKEAELEITKMNNDKLTELVNKQDQLIKSYEEQLENVKNMEQYINNLENTIRGKQ